MRRTRPPRETLERALGPGHDVTTLLADLRAGRRARFHWPPARATEIARGLADRSPAWATTVTRDAERITDHVMRLLGADELRLGARLPWHEDPLHDYAWDSRRYFKSVPVPVGRADIKVPWELSRFQHLPTLGMAYSLTGEERFAAEVGAQVRDWLDANPYGYGVNWASTMDVAIRAVNWAWAIQLVASSAAVDDDLLTTWLASMAQHGRHIAGNLEIYEGGVTTNHTLADYVGLLYIAALLPELRGAGEWTRLALDGVTDCMRTHVLPDGADYENSIPYHRLVLEMFAAAWLLAERIGQPLPADYHASLARMFDFVLGYTRPDGRAPLVGDSDDGRLLILADYFDWDPLDHRYLLGLGGALLGRDDLSAAGAAAPGSAEAVAWLMGDAGRAVSPALAPPPGPRSRSFPHAGRWTMRGADAFVLVSADAVGTAGLGNHKHNDILGFELCVGETPLVVDRGSYTYTADPEARDAFRSTRAHSTVCVDGKEQNEAVGPFGMRSDAAVAVHEWRNEEALDLLDAEHTGYARLADPVVHRRTFVLRKRELGLVVVDRLTCAGEHDFDSYVQLAPEVEITPGELDGATVAAALDELAVAELPAAARELAPGRPLMLARGAANVVLVPLGALEPAVESGWFAPRYGQRVPAPAVRLRGRAAGDTLFGYVLLPA
jgi:hypothetical protein